MSKEIQKDDFILPGGLGSINGGEIVKAESDFQKGSITLTVKPPKYVSIGEVVKTYLDKKDNIEDADFEVVQPKQIENESTA